MGRGGGTAEEVIKLPFGRLELASGRVWGWIGGRIASHQMKNHASSTKPQVWTGHSRGRFSEVSWV